MKQIEYAQFDGLRNTVPVDRFEKGDLDAATNIDLDDSKVPMSRYGFGSVLVAGVDRALWSDGDTCLGVGSNALKQIHTNWSTTTLRSGLTGGLDLSYVPNAARVYYTNGVENGVVENGANRTWGIAIPTHQPDAADMGGSLRPGRYQYAVTYLRADGQESGTLIAGVITIEDGGIRLTNIPVSSDTGVTHKAIYVTPHDGTALLRVGTITNATTTFDYLSRVPSRIDLTKKQHLRPPLPGQLAAIYNGRMLVAVGSRLTYSEPYAYELFDPRKHFNFASRITLVAPLESGAYIGTQGQVWWVSGKMPEQWVLTSRLSYGAIPVRPAFCSRDMVLDGQGAGDVAVFATTKGMCVGMDGGQVVNVTQDRYLLPVQEKGSTVIRMHHRGFVQCLVSMQGTES